MVPHQMQTQGGIANQARGLVKFNKRIEIVPQDVEFEDMNAGWKLREIHVIPKEIGVDLNMEDNWSKVSKVSDSHWGMAPRQPASKQTEHQGEGSKGSAMGPSSNYYEILQQEDNKDKGEEEDEEQQGSNKVSSSFNPTYSDVDSQEYSRNDSGSEGKFV
jgi:hypothetical protein